MHLIPGSFMDPVFVASECHLPKGLCVLDPVCRSCRSVGLKEFLHFAYVTVQEVGQSMTGREDLSEQGSL